MNSFAFSAVINPNLLLGRPPGRSVFNFKLTLANILLHWIVVADVQTPKKWPTAAGFRFPVRLESAWRWATWLTATIERRY